VPAHEERNYKRSPAYLGAKIYFDGTPSTFDCVVRNMSDNGARLNIEAVWGIPDNFQLYISKYNHYYDCQTRWKNHNKLGIHFSKRSPGARAA
jgi:PilZ domain